MTMRRGEWWDDDAPHGTHGYTFGRGEEVNMTGVHVVREFTFLTTDRQASMRGAAELSDGRVYQLTVLRPGHSRSRDGRERVRFASLSRKDFRSLAAGLLEWEVSGKRVDPAKVDGYRKAVDAL